MSSIVVITTGGTIASRSDAGGAKVAGGSGAQLLAGVALPPGVRVEVRDVLSRNSAALTLADLDRLRAAVGDALDSGVDAVVLTHGTDTTEETALLLDLVHDDPRPVVLTGAQRAADDPTTDGPANLRDALLVAADPGARGLGVLVVFDGAVFAARGTRKVHTLASAAFADPDSGPLGRVVLGELDLLRRPDRPAGLRDVGPLPRVDIVALYPGVDAVALDAYVAAGAAGLILEAPGLGNSNPAIAAAIRRHVHADIPVVLSTRVSAGPVRAVYGGGGGGRDLLAAGAVLAGWLRPAQARIQLAVLLAAGAGTDTIRSIFANPTTREALTHG
jgi:L-asparaginase